MELILAHWWQFSIIVLVLLIALVFAGKSTETIIILIKDTLLTLAREAIFKTASSRAASVNVIMLIFSGVIAIALVIPNILVQLGLKEENNSFLIFLGVIQFLMVGGGSGYGIYLFEKTLPAFKDDTDVLEPKVKEENKVGDDKEIQNQPKASNVQQIKAKKDKISK